MILEAKDVNLHCKCSFPHFSYSTVIPRDHLQRPNGIEVIDVDGDGTTAMLSVPVDSDHIMSSLTSHKNEVRLCDVILTWTMIQRLLAPYFSFIMVILNFNNMKVKENQLTLLQKVP